MGSTRMFWLLIFSFGLLFNNLSEAKHEKKLPSAVVVGTVYCDTCFQQDFSRTSHFISGASVSVECGDGGSEPSFHQEVQTDEHGQFKVHLPFAVSKHVKSIKGCSVKLISSSEPFCAVASTATSSSLHLKSRKQGVHIFSAGFFSFKPLKQPDLCNQKPKLETSKEFSPKKTGLSSPSLPLFPPVTQDPTVPSSPPATQNPALPQLPPLPQLPQLPPLPTLSPIPHLPQLPPLPILSPLPFLPRLPGVPNLPPLMRKPTQTKAYKLSDTNSLSGLKSEKTISFFSPPSLPFLPSPSPPFGLPLPPNPFQPPPLLPPNPLQPTPPSLLPPNPFQPTPPSFSFPPIPFLTPPPPPPTFRFPFPPFPFPPRFPGIPPASSSQRSSP
ncbi:PREDICTED: vegetative cell wall protein gp1 [Nelumbo nucifera]|uniref:Vegetative cell wall protein gp1 n=1 Tax=Nelumbo nucifera TaxID=4432 RepID=A0A1U8A784_NELNU|nr:PREDICTED: vegetative cell wall protein gp1 [Nelumbo nucifera]